MKPLHLFAEDTKILKSIQTSNNALDLRSDIDSLVERCRECKLRLNKIKCAAVRYSLLSKRITQPTYIVKHISIKSSTTHCDLGIMVDQNKHCNHISFKANHSLHFICRIIPLTAPVSLKKQLYISGAKGLSHRQKLYISLVRSNLTYSSQLWRPCLIKTFNHWNGFNTELLSSYYMIFPQTTSQGSLS